MEYRLLGRTGLKVSALSYGSWVSFRNQVNTTSAYEIMREAYKAGINLFDMAETYADGEAEVIAGEAFQQGFQEGVWDRDDLVITTKIFFGAGKTLPNSRGLSRKHIIEGTKASLKRLKLDYVDLIFCHRPDPITPMEEIVRAWNFVINQGWAFYWGTSEWNAQQITEACLIADKLGLIAPVFDQPEYSMLHRERVEIEYLPIYKNYGYGLTTWSPLASGILTGKYSGGQVPEGARLGLADFKWLADAKLKQKRDQIDLVDKLKPVAQELGCTMAQLAIAWCVRNKDVSTVILGATSLKQLHENIQALDVVPKLTAEVLEKIEAILGNKPQHHPVMQHVMRLRQ